MASEKEVVHDLQASILQKTGGKTVEELLKTLTSKDAADHLYEILADFRDALIGQPRYILDALSENKLFCSWLLNAVKVLSDLILDSRLKEEPFPLIEKVQPLIDLFYYFNKIHFSIVDVLFELEVIKAIALDIRADKRVSYPSGIELVNYRIKVGEQIYYKIQMINQKEILSPDLERLDQAYMELLDASMRDDSSVNFKTLFLKLFKNDQGLQDLCIEIRRAKQWPIDWPIVLRHLSEYLNDNFSEFERDSLSERTKFFTKVLWLTGALEVIPKFSDLELPLANIEDTPSSSDLLEALDPTSDDKEEAIEISYLELPTANIEDTPSSSESLEALDSKSKVQNTPIYKFGDIVMPKILEKLDLANAFTSKDANDPLYEAIAYFCNALSKQPGHILDDLYKNKTFIAWCRKAVNFLSGFFLNTVLFNPEFQKRIQPLIDLLYCFNKIDSTIESVLFRFELAKLLNKKYTLSPESQEALIEDATRFYSVFIKQPLYVLDSLYRNISFTEWIRKNVTLLLNSFLNGSMFDPTFQTKIQPLIDLLYYFNTVDSTIRVVLLRFEITKLLLTENPLKRPDIYERYFKEQLERYVLIEPDEFRFGHRTFARIINVIFENCYCEKKPEFQLNSRLERACFIAWLIPHIKNQLQQKKLANDPLFNDLFIYLQGMHEVYLSRDTISRTYNSTNKVFSSVSTKDKKSYSDDTSDNTSIIEQFRKATDVVDKRLQSINARVHSEVELKTSFLKLFSPDPMFSFFFLPNYQIVNTIKETDDLYINWYYILERLLAEIEASPSETDNAMKSSQHINTFVTELAETLELKIPTLSELDANTENIENVENKSGPSVKL